MKKKWFMIIIGFVILLTLTGCSYKSNIEEINLTTLKEKITTKESFILEVVQTGCSHCEEFSPRLKSVLKKYNITAYSINLSNLTTEEKEELKKISEIKGTPTTLFFKEGGEDLLHRLVGAVSNSEIEKQLKDTGYIK